MLRNDAELRGLLHPFDQPQAQMVEIWPGLIALALWDADPEQVRRDILRDEYLPPEER